MARIAPPNPDELQEFAPMFERTKANMGFVPTSLYNMARKPEMLRAFGALFGAVFGGGEVAAPLKQLCAHMASVGSGCRYCQAHTASHAASMGIAVEKVEALQDFDTSPLFDRAERAALSLALAAGKSPSEVTDAHFTELKKHFTDAQIIEIVGAIAVFGFLNRWNDTLATDLEDCPLDFARAHLAPRGWEIGNHGG